MSNASRILFIENNAAYFLSHRLSLARAAQALGYEVHVATNPDAAAADVSAAGLEFHPLRFSLEGMHAINEVATMKRVQRLYLNLRPLLVYQVNTKPVIYGTLAARRARTPAVISVISGRSSFASQSGVHSKAIRKMRFALYRIALRYPNQKVIFDNDDDRQIFVSQKVLKREDSEVMPGSGINIDYFMATPEPAGTPLVVLPARMLRDKGVYEFVAAAELLRAQDIQARFLLAGDTEHGNPQAISAVQLQRWRVQCGVEWLGNVSDVRKLYANSHVVCLPSYGEALPEVLLEAAACGRPVVTTGVKGCRDVVVEQETGLLVPPRNTEKLATALRSLIQNPGLRERLGKGARQLAEKRFATQRIVADTLRIISELIESRPAPYPQSAEYDNSAVLGTRR